MTVADFQHVLDRVADLIEVGGKATGVGAIRDLRAALDRFRSRPLKDFAATVSRMDESGAVAPKHSQPRVPKAAPAGVSPAAVGADLKSLYERAADPATTEAEIDSFCGRLAGFTVPVLKEAAAAINYLVPAKLRAKKDVIAGIRDRIDGRRGASLRNQLNDRPLVG